MRRAVPVTRRVAAIAAAVGASILLPACANDPTQGYSTKSVYSDSIQTIAVPIFENHTYIRDIQFQLTDAIIKEIESRTPYRVAAQGTADTELVGQIRRVELDQLSKSPFTGLGEEVLTSVTIDFRWTDIRVDETLVDRRSFTGYGLFTPSTPQSERVELGQTAVVQKLARDVVDEMQSGW